MALVMLTGCSLLTSLDDLSGGVIDVPLGGGTSPTDAGATDVRSNAPTDGSSDGPSDASTDAAEASSPPSCGGDVFCDGFERSDVLGAWDAIGGANGALSIATAAPHSGSSFLRVTLPGAEGAGKSLHHRIPASKTEKMSFSVRLDRLGGRHINVGALDFEYSDHVTGVFLIVDNGQVKLVEQSLPADTYQEHASRPFSTGQWVDVSLTIDHTTTPQRVTATLDGETIAQDVPLKHSIPPQGATAIAGADYASAGSVVTLDVDDVRVERTPL